MRALARNLGLFVPGHGLRDFVGAKWTVPDTSVNTMTGVGRLGDFVGAPWSVPDTSVNRMSGVGDFVGTAAMYPIPINSVLADAAEINYQGGLTGLKGGHECGCGCGGSGGCGGGLQGISTDFTTMWSALTTGNWSGAWTGFTTMMSEPVIGTVPLWVILGGGLLAYALIFSGGEHSRYSRGRRAYRSARSSYA